MKVGFRVYGLGLALGCRVWLLGSGNLGFRM